MLCPVCHQLHRERAVIGRIFQALPTHTDTTVALIILNLMFLQEFFSNMFMLLNSLESWDVAQSKEIAREASTGTIKLTK
jgi:hypothetical protein